MESVSHSLALGSQVRAAGLSTPPGRLSHAGVVICSDLPRGARQRVATPERPPYAVVRSCVTAHYRESRVCLAPLHPLGSDRSGPIERLLALAGGPRPKTTLEGLCIGPPEP